MKTKTIILLFSIILTTYACSKSDAVPAFMGSEKVADDGSAPSVDEELAEEVGQQRIIYHVGPIDLPAKTSPESMIEKPLVMRFQTDRDLWITGFEPRVVDAHGEELPAGLLHQAVVSNMHEENPTCADVDSSNPFFIANSLLTEINLPEGYGYPILSSDPIDVSIILANPTDENYPEVYFEITLIARPMNELSAFSDVKPMLLEMDPCGHTLLSIEPATFVEQSATYEVPAESSLIMAFGIIADYGSAVGLTSGDEPTPFWRAEARLTEDRHVTGLDPNPFEDPAGIPLEAGESITFSVAYDNFTDSWLSAATGAAMVYLAAH